VNRLVFSPDDKFLACIGQNNTFIIWNVQDGTPIHTKVSEIPFSMLTWGNIITDVNPKHPTYSIITGSHQNVFINKLEFDIASMQYFLK